MKHESTLIVRAMQPLSDFAIQFNKNSFGLVPAQPLHIPAPVFPNQTTQVSCCDRESLSNRLSLSDITMYCAAR